MIASLPFCLRRVVSRKDSQHLLRAGDAARVEDGRGEVRGVAVELLLVCAVRVHLEERLRIYLTAVVVFPARVRDGAAARMNLRVVAVHLVEADAAHELAVAVHQEHVARAHVPAVHVLKAARGAEHDVAVRKIDSLVVGHALSERQLTHGACRHVHFVEMVVVVAGGLLPREEDALAVVRNVRVAYHAVVVVDQRRLPDVQPFVQRQHAQAGAGLEVELLLHAAGVEDVLVAHGVGVGVVRAAHVEVLGEHHAVQLLAERTQQPLAFAGAHRKAQCTCECRHHAAEQKPTPRPALPFADVHITQCILQTHLPRHSRAKPHGLTEPAETSLPR